MSSAKRRTQRFLDADGAVIGTAQFVGEKLDGLSQIFFGGVLTQEEHYVAGLLHGQYRSWWNDGTPKEHGSFVQGNRTGIYRWYGLDGSLLQERNYGSAL